MTEYLSPIEMCRRGGGGMRRGGGRRGRGGFEPRGERVLAMNELRLLLLSLVGEEERHGYDLIRRIKSLTLGRYSQSSGMVYPALNELAASGLISRASDGARKPFAITEAGTAEISGSGDAIKDILAKLEVLRSASSEGHVPIRRAMTNLDHVLANMLAEPSAERINAIVELIDRAAREIERLGN